MKRLSGLTVFAVLAIGIVVIAIVNSGDKPVTLGTSPTPSPTPVVKKDITGWTSYLASADHSSRSKSQAITAKNVKSLRRAWTFTAPAGTRPGQPGAAFFASPVSSGGSVFIGSKSGEFYSLNLETGKVQWSRFLGFAERLTCPQPGIVSTATIATDPKTGLPTVYVGGGDGNVYAMDAATGKLVWKTEVVKLSSEVNDFYLWSSPVIVDGRVYIGTASSCDRPLVYSELRSYDQTTGERLASWSPIGKDELGGGIWTTPASDGKSVWVATGNGVKKFSPGDVNSLVRLRAENLSFQGSWRIPVSSLGDSDFGSSPTLFTAKGRPMVGACNKDGFFYALRAKQMKLAWKVRISEGSDNGTANCLGAPVPFKRSLLISGPARMTPSGKLKPGLLRKVDAATGRVIWKRQLSGAGIAAMSMNAAGILAVPEFDVLGSGTALELFNARTGKRLRRLPSAQVFAQPCFIGSYLLVAEVGGTLTAWEPSGRRDGANP